MLRYEALMLAVPEITQDEVKNLETQFEGAVSGNKGNMLSFERWGKYRLAYPVDKNEYGVYFLARFETAEKPEALLKALQTLFKVKVNDLVMRDMIAKLDPSAPLTYQRPHSLEEAPAHKDVNAFLRENKMEGVFGNQRPSRGGQDSDDMDDEGASA
ncbi:MAG TPA: 30S ribosomal protein S6 [Candidatus Babeliales bacterium]|nr:30S ribosomal protein S6 [Candidatus Babeliales bacterium]